MNLQQSQGLNPAVIWSRFSQSWSNFRRPVSIHIYTYIYTVSGQAMLGQTQKIEVDNREKKQTKLGRHKNKNTQ